MRPRKGKLQRKASESPRRYVDVAAVVQQATAVVEREDREGVFHYWRPPGTRTVPAERHIVVVGFALPKDGGADRRPRPFVYMAFVDHEGWDRRLRSHLHRYGARILVAEARSGPVPYDGSSIPLPDCN